MESGSRPRTTPCTISPDMSGSVALRSQTIATYLQSSFDVFASTSTQIIPAYGVLNKEVVPEIIRISGARLAIHLFRQEQSSLFI